jgi:hypothetical protein
MCVYVCMYECVYESMISKRLQSCTFASVDELSLSLSLSLATIFTNGGARVYLQETTFSNVFMYA